MKLSWSLLSEWKFQKQKKSDWVLWFGFENKNGMKINDALIELVLASDIQYYKISFLIPQ